MIILKFLVTEIIKNKSIKFLILKSFLENLNGAPNNFS